ncbi:putative membrane protein [Chitinispirillum alkaliphilum]|nr:putative membrane protein [Chitinispirillum alkaliphilum]
MTLLDSYDVIVVGGGPGGICAAAAASLQGASTLLVERYGFLGGMATAGLVNPFMAYKDENDVYSNRIFNEIIKRLSSNNALCKEGYVFDDEMLKVILDELMRDCGVDVLFHSFLTDVTVEEGEITQAHFAGKSGRMSLSAGIFIDSTGDGDLANASGVPFSIGREEDNACQPMSLCFRVSGITGNPDPIRLGKELTLLLNEAKKENVVVQPREDVLLFRTLSPGTYHFNTTRILQKLGTCSKDLTDAEIEGRRQTFELFNLFKQGSPRFENAFVSKIACQIGVRETRRIKGEYTITDEDILSARKFPDGISRSNYPLDIHNPVGSGTILKAVPENDYYEVPYRCLIPEGIDNLLIGSRCISSSHTAHSSLRVMPVVAGIGEAAGLAAALAGQLGLAPSELDGSELKRKILTEELKFKEPMM